MRRALMILVLLAAPALAGGGDAKFSLKLDKVPLTPKVDVRTEARLAEWNSPMGRLMYQFNQQQAWIMRGTMPGGDRVNGLAIRAKAQNGLPLGLIAASTRAGSDLAHNNLYAVRWPWIDDAEIAAMPLDEQISLALGRRLVP
jgi:hypothetical protein